jgi:hypothetical protein
MSPKNPRVDSSPPVHRTHIIIKCSTFAIVGKEVRIDFEDPDCKVMMVSRVQKGKKADKKIKFTDLLDHCRVISEK